MVHSYPSIVGLSKIGKLNSSLGVPELSYIVEIVYQMHIDSLGKVIENLGGRFTCQPNCVQLNSFESRTTLWVLRNLNKRARFVSRSILILPFGNMCITIMSLSFSMLVSCVSSLESISCLGTSKKLSLGV